MKKAIIWICGAVAFVLLIVGAYLLYGKLAEDNKGDSFVTEPLSSDSQVSEHTAPDFTVTDYNGNKVKLSDMRGKPVVVNFWATWCYYCKEEMPDFEQMYKKYGNDVVFMMVDMTDGGQETVAGAKKHVEENGYTFPVYFDTDLEAAYAYSVTSLPATYLIDSNGDLVAHASGMINAEALEQGISMILDK